MSLHALRDDWLMPMGPSLVARAERLAAGARRHRRRDRRGQGRRRPGRGQAERRRQGDRRRACQRHAQGGPARQRRRAAPDAAEIERLGRWIAEQTGASFGWLVDGGNAVGAQLVARAAGRGRRERRAHARQRGAAQGLHPDERRARRSMPPIGAAAAAALGKAEMVVSLTAVPAGARRRSRRRAAADRALHRDLGHLRQRRRPGAELPRRRQAAAARRGRPGRCCACSATCSGCGGFSFETLGRSAGGSARRPRRRSRRGCAAAGSAGARSRRRCRARPAALERIADVPIYCRRRDRPPRPGAADDRRCRAAGGRRAERARRRARHRRRRPGAHHAGRPRRWSCRRASIRRWRRTWSASPRRIRSPPRSARCSAASRSRSSRWPRAPAPSPRAWSEGEPR